MIREIQSQDVSSTIDVASLHQTETIVPLTAQNISAPFGIEVVGVTPTRVRLRVEKTVTKTVPVVAVIVGEPADGLHVISSSIMPAVVDIQGPETRVLAIERVRTTMIDVSAQKETIRTTVELDPEEPLVRIPRIGPIHVEVVIGPQ
jgi:YbbR domain-containing protein